jgi:uncharacterized protein (TIGR03437 family)
MPFHRLKRYFQSPAVGTVLRSFLGTAIALQAAAAASPASLSLSSSASTSSYGSRVTLTAAISPAGASGSVTFYNGVTPLATVPVSSGQAKYSTSLLPAGVDSLHAYYSGDSNYSPATGAVTQNVQVQPGGGFGAPHNNAVGYMPWSLAVGDFNEDGKPDIAVAFHSSFNTASMPVTVSLGNGDGTFQTPTAYAAVKNARWIASGDFNGDGHADLAVADFDGDSVSILLGNGDGTFGPAHAFPTGSGSNPFALVVADFNGDGKADIAVTDDGAQAVTVLLGNGDGAFRVLAQIPCGDDPRSIAAADFNSDGATDLVIGNYTGSMVTVLAGNGDGTFKAAKSYPVASAGDSSTTTNPRSIAVADFNGDGKLDLAVANQGTGTVDILTGNGDGTFAASQSACQACSGTGAFLDNPYSVAAADVTGDKIPDLVVANYGSNNVTLMKGLGNGQFTLAGSFAADAGALWVTVASLRGNGIADVVTANLGAGTISVLPGMPPAPDLSIAWSTQSVSQAAFSIAVSNVGFSPTAGLVTVNISLPPGVTASQLQGPGWSCSPAALVCDRSDSLPALGNYPALSLTLAFSSDASRGITLAAAVSGGGDVNSANNSAHEYATTFSPAAVASAWSQLTVTSPPPAGLANFDAPLLMTDGSVLVHKFCSSDWYKLTPDLKGDYSSGKWTQIASMPSNYSPLYFASAVLADGRLAVIGGEYNGGNCSAHIFTPLGAIYDPVADAWTPLKAPGGWTQVGDAPSSVLPDGRMLLGDINSKALAALDPRTLAWTELTGNGKFESNSEEGWTLLPDGSIFTVDVADAGQSERYFPSTDTWILAGDTIAPLATAREMGPQVLLPTGSVFTAGATGHTALYNAASELWTAGPDFPTGPSGPMAMADAPGVLLPSGNVLLAASAHFPDSLSNYQQLSFFFEFNGASLTPEPAPSGNTTGSYRSHLLLLPSGKVLFTDAGNAAIYSPSGAASPEWAPAISAAPATVQAGGSYTISGTQFNGLSQAVMYGDDYQAATNFPLVQIANNATGHLFYCRTHDHSTMAVATGAAVVSTQFDVPASVETGPSTVVVIANGIASAPRSLTVAAAAAPSVTIAAVEGGALTVPAVAAISSDGYFTIFGSGFQAGSPTPHTAGALAADGAFPVTLGSACVHVGSASAFLTYVSDTQINAIAPLLPPTASIPITVSANCGALNQSTSAAVKVAVAAATPEFLYWAQSTSGQDPVIAIGSDGSLIGPAGQSGGPAFRAAHAGETITVYGIGFGATKGGPVPGLPPRAADAVVGTFSVSIGNASAVSSYAGVTPESAGLYQLDVTVPSNLAPGNYPIVLTINGVSTPTGGFLAVGP